MTPFDDLPDSVRGYLSAADIAQAAEHLTADRKDRLPDGLGWDAYGDFLAARASAHLIRAEYPIALWRFWRFVWEDALPAEWIIETPDELGVQLIGPLTMWQDKNIAVRHRSSVNKLQLYTLVGMESGKTVLGFALEDDGGDPLISEDDGVFVWHTEDYNGYMVAEWPVSITADFPWAELAAARDYALGLIGRAVKAK